MTILSPTTCRYMSGSSCVSWVSSWNPRRGPLTKIWRSAQNTTSKQSWQKLGEIVGPLCCQRVEVERLVSLEQAFCTSFSESFDAVHAHKYIYEYPYIHVCTYSYVCIYCMQIPRANGDQRYGCVWGWLVRFCLGSPEQMRIGGSHATKLVDKLGIGGDTRQGPTLTTSLFSSSQLALRSGPGLLLQIDEPIIHFILVRVLPCSLYLDSWGPGSKVLSSQEACP